MPSTAQGPQLPIHEWSDKEQELSTQIYNSQIEGDSGSKAQSNRTSGTESLAEKQAVRIQWERTWGPESSTNAGMDSLRAMDQSLPLFGVFPHLQNERVGSYDATSSQQQQP